ncbi:MAG: HAD-IA family hydrolase [Nitrosopumilaceae archaeon]|nr:HAD-IA family hydrolase [Nitrosopumilaceae archaeon]
MSKFQLVLFDIGGVLVNWRDAWLYHVVSEKFGVQEKILTSECEKEIVNLHTGKISENEFWRKIGKKVKSSELQKVKKSLIHDTFKDKAKLNNSILKMVKKIQENKIKVGVLSNLEKTTHTILEEFGFLDIFEFQVYSHKIGFAKPDRRIFKYVLGNVPFKSSEIFFIDDKISNVQVANSIGIKSIKYVNAKKLKQDLKRHKIL